MAKVLIISYFHIEYINSLNLANFSLHELVFGRKPKILLNLENTPDITVSGTFKDYHELLNKRLKYFHEILQNFKLKMIALINKDRTYFQYNSRVLVYIISPLTIQLHMASNRVMIKYVGPIVVYKIRDPHNYLLMMLDGKLLRGLFEHERLKPAILRTSEGNVTNLVKLKQLFNTGLSFSQ